MRVAAVAIGLVVSAVALQLVGVPLMSPDAFAKPTRHASLPEDEARLNVASIARVIPLSTTGNTDVRAVLIDLGLSTDVSPRYALMLTYFGAGEQSNRKTAFLLARCREIQSAGRVKEGVYRFVVLGAEDGGEQVSTLTVDATQVFVDDRNLNPEEFSDPYFKSSVLVTEE